MPQRTPRINITAGPFGDYFDLDEAQKAKIEAGYGQELSTEIWKDIILVTGEFTINRPTVEAAPSLAKTLERIHKLADAARSLRRTINPNAVDAADLTLADIWQVYFNFARRKTPPRISDFFVFLLEIIQPVIAISNFAKEHQKDEEFFHNLQGPDEDFYWNSWIIDLSDILDRHDLPSAARKDTDKKASNTQSAFVRFVSEFQKYLPAQCRKFTQSEDALAQAIYRAREWHKRGIENESREIFEEADRLIEEGKRRKRAEIARLENVRKWRLYDVRSFAFGATLTEEELELRFSSNEAADLIRKGKIEAAEQAALNLIARFPDAHDGYDRLGMVHEARGEKRLAAECYRKVIELITRHPDNHNLGLDETFATLADELDPRSSA